jgi:hypothetical protein
MDIVHVVDVLAVAMSIAQVPASFTQTRRTSAAMPLDRLGDGHHGVES